ncbi:MAG: hypothetical protein KA144_12300 [Xanthomonadaceae bacterium]|nr:hypothetical protein [Xanthomonadaceae bacterium]
MASYVLQISAHAEPPSHDRTFPIAEGWTFKFFVSSGQELPYGISEDIYKELCAGDVAAADKRVKNTYFPDSPLTDYDLWSLNDVRYVSGALKVGESTALVDIGDIERSAPISLSNLLALIVEELGIDVGKDEVTVYFNACR